MERLVRICDIELNGFKNVRHGYLSIDAGYADDKASLLGIYGQNGSGKTSVIEAMEFVQTLLMGKSLPQNAAEYINAEMGFCEIKIGFCVKADSCKSRVNYNVRLEKRDESFVIAGEELSYCKWNGDKYNSKHTVVEHNSDDLMSYKPKYRCENLIKVNPDNRINIAMAKKISLKDRNSFIFNEEGRKLFSPRWFAAIEDEFVREKSIEATSDYDHIIKSLYDYARLDLFVITSKHNGPISMELLMPVAFRVRHHAGIAKGNLPILLSQPSDIPEEAFEIVERIIAEINIVLSAVIPGMSLEVYNHGKQLLKDGMEGYRIELLSRRGDVVIPLKYESEGIIKIISILNVLMCVYNNPGMCMMVDELDSGIFEFLLGEILAVFENGAKGQLIFTSHNLRALEMMEKDHLIFSTTNEDNRYIKLKNVKNSNNVRDLYLRAITLGGQSEEIYAETDSVEIGRALRKAGRMASNGRN